MRVFAAGQGSSGAVALTPLGVRIILTPMPAGEP